MQLNYLNNLQHYNFYLFLNIDTKNKIIKLLNGIHDKDIIKLSNIYNPNFVKEKITSNNLNILKSSLLKNYNKLNNLNYLNFDDRYEYKNMINNMIKQHGGKFEILLSY